MRTDDLIRHADFAIMLLFQYCGKMRREKRPRGFPLGGLRAGVLGGVDCHFPTLFLPLLSRYATDCSSIPQEVRVC